MTTTTLRTDVPGARRGPGWRDGLRPVTLAVLAMGGEGGGVLADWIVAVGEEAGWTAQTTSVAGVAQRTGATVYYVEMLPPPAGGVPVGGRREPVLSLFPTPGEVDIVIASELMECGRAVQRGFATPDRTTLITSTNRVYSVDEKIGLGDGRVDADELFAAAQRAARVLVAADFARMADDAGSVISASLYGALAGSGALPFTREQFEAPIRAFPKAAEKSLRAFAAAYTEAAGQVSADGAGTAGTGPAGTGTATATAGTASSATGPGGAEAGEEPVTAAPARPAAPGGPVPVTIGRRRPETEEDRKRAAERERTRIAASDPASLVGPALTAQAGRTALLPAAARSTVLHGVVRTAVYQGPEYADRYLDRVARVAAADPDRDGDAALTREAGRHIALWMCYQDTIQVALQKTRRHRMARVREEAKAGEGHLAQVREFLHPQVEELTDMMPARLGAWLLRSRVFGRLVHLLTHRGLVLNTTSVTGFTALAVLARMRPLRPRSLRFVREQEAIDAWLDLALAKAADGPRLAREIIECQRVLKGYGATYAHGDDSFGLLMAAARELPAHDGSARRLEALRAAALADEDGATLREELANRPVAG
ncbi:indolepyruvate oxidoreductase subunit beta family protein [Streptomyces abyssomicinicus]|uniref:indolepyruvate oxidoreductase subunit beta family protein n=1 Tax=Streptomyces abyssomicinicus TaxID=574929 RepID=UPI00124F80F9|nr:indolepyruvate oxidoreductase subunit beta family protein [Streptomyces abyssomicinicus]